MFGILRTVMTKANTGITQQRIIEYVQGFISEQGYSPSVRDIAKALGLAASTVHEHLSHLRTRGVFTHEPRQSRSIRFTSEKPEVIEIPLLGQIAAGRPMLAVEDIKESIPLPKEFAQAGNYIIKVQGDSMIEKGIHDGDYVVMHEQKTAQDGDIVAALIEDEVTLKQFYKKKNHIILRPANLKYEDIKVKDVQVLGKLVSLFRKY